MDVVKTGPRFFGPPDLEVRITLKGKAEVEATKEMLRELRWNAKAKECLAKLEAVAPTHDT